MREFIKEVANKIKNTIGSSRKIETARNSKTPSNYHPTEITRRTLLKKKMEVTSSTWERTSRRNQLGTKQPYFCPSLTFSPPMNLFVFSSYSNIL